MSGVDLEKYFPPSPTVPPGLTEPSAAYKRHAWLALAGLLVFVGVYLGLTSYLGWTVWRLLRGVMHGSNPIGAGLASVPALLLLFFLVRGLFVIKHSKDESLVELKRDEQPTLFAFLDRLADETHAPRPHRVYLSARVNAAVFYELSFWNLVFPTKKNLELGLGLVNVLSLDELKAVIAHEYGHFAQRTMAVGRWAYLAQQIASHIVISRGKLDGFLAGLSVQDIRIAWIGWVLRVIVWSVRAVLDTAFKLVVMAHRALGREMEFQADRVAVSVTGSDSLIHALHRLGAADDSWTDAANFAADERRAGRSAADLFELQTQALEALRTVLGEPEFGRTPARGSGAAHRVFDQALAQPPRMWLTHPPNREREESAKAHYVPSPLDERSAWVLFRDPEALRARVTDALFAKLERAANSPPVNGTAQERFARRYSHIGMKPTYRGAYMGRAVAAWDTTYEALLGPTPLGGRDGVIAALDRLYPTSLRATLKQYRERYGEEEQLEGLAEGVLSAPGGSIRYQGRELRRKELPDVLERVRGERKRLEAELRRHDRDVRTAHLGAAQLVGNGWAEHLQQLVALLHLATHAQRTIQDEHSHLHHVLAIVLADQSVSSSERSRVLSASLFLHQALVSAWEAKEGLTLPSDVLKHFEVDGAWETLDQKLGLPAPNQQQLGDWLNASDGWAYGATNDLIALSTATLSALLEAEEKVAGWLRSGEPAEPAPTAAVVPSGYLTCVVGSERPRQKKLGWWDRFQTADGFIPGTLRAAVAAAVLIPTLSASGSVGSTTLHVVNGLGQPVTVTVGTQRRSVGARQVAKLELDETGAVQVRAETSTGELVEAFEADVGGAFVDVVYDVAQATPLVEWTAVYGSHSPVSDRPVGAPRWLNARQNHIFEQPPRSISSNGGGTRSVLEAVFEVNSGPGYVTEPKEQEAMTLAHVRFDPLDDAAFGVWLAAAQAYPAATDTLLSRARTPRVVVVERALQDMLSPEARAERCDELSREAAAAPNDGDLAYLSIRCLPDTQRAAAYRSAWAKNEGNAWLSWAAADDLATERRWNDSLRAWERALTDKALRPIHVAGAIEALRTIRAANAAGLKKSVPSWVTTPPTRAVTLALAADGTELASDDPPIKVYRALNKGDTSAATRIARQQHMAPAFLTLLDVLIGCADGATEAQREAALRVQPSALNDDYHWILAALAVRAGRDATPWLQSGQRPELLATLSTALGGDPQQLDVLAAQLHTRERGLLYAAGAIALGDAAPAHWRREAKTLLFAFERPWFR